MGEVLLRRAFRASLFFGIAVAAFVLGPRLAGIDGGGGLGPVAAAGLSDSAPPSPPGEVVSPAPASLACTPISQSNAQSLTQTGQVAVGEGKLLEWSSAGDAFWAVGRNEVFRIDAATLQKTMLYSGTSVVLDLNPDSGVVALTADELSIQLRNLLTQQNLGTVTPSGQFSSAGLSPDGALLAVSLRAEIAAEVRRTSDGSFVRKYTGFMTGSPVYTAFFTPDGQSLIWLARARVQVMDLATGAFRPALEHEDFVMAISVAAGRLATAFGSGLRLWNPTTGVKLADYSLGPNGAFAAALNHDASLVVGGNKSDVVFFETATNQQVADIVRPGTLLALSPDECTLLAGSADGAVAVLTVPAPPPSGPVTPPNTGDGGLLPR